MRPEFAHPALREPREMWTFPDTFTGNVARWAVTQSPYPVPKNLEVVLKKLDESIRPQFVQNAFGMKRFDSFDEVEVFLTTHLRRIPEYLAWNERRNGNDNPLKFTSRYEGPGDPDDDFIDLGALERNVTNSIVREHEMERDVYDSIATSAPGE